MKQVTILGLILSSLILGACAEESSEKKNDGPQYINGVRVCTASELDGMNRIFSNQYNITRLKQECQSYFANKSDMSSCAATATSTINTSSGTIYPGQEVKIDTVKLKEVCDSIK